MKRTIVSLCGLLAWATAAAAADFKPVQCEGGYSHHLQGVCVSDDALFWCFTTQLVKTDLEGKWLAQVAVANHHGDLCYHDGKVYVAVNLGKFNRPAGEADSWIYVYDSSDLKELARYETQQLVHGAGGMAYRNGRFIVIGGLPEGIEENYLYEYDEDFRFLKRHVLPSGYTRLGIQTAAFGEGRWLFGCYGKTLLITDEDFQLLGRYDYDCSLGVDAIGDGRFLSAGGRRDSEKGHLGWVKIATLNDEKGMRIVE